MQTPHFSPDDLSRRTPDLGAVTRDRQLIIQSILVHYLGPNDDLREVRQILTRASLNTNYLVDLGSGTYVLKCRAGEAAQQAIARECKLLSVLAARGVRVPKLVASSAGEAAVFAHDAAWMLAVHVPGEHFVGDGLQLEAVAAELGSLVRALRDVTLDDDPSPTSGGFLQELPDLVRAIDHAQPSPLRSLVEDHRGVVAEALGTVIAERASIETPCGLVHVDLHPMNVLLDGDVLACLLDMEDVITYPLFPALGFDGYKLIRRVGDRQLAPRWVAACQRALPELEIDAHVLGMGARYRELAAVTYILRQHLEHSSFADGIEARKHLRAFSELDWLFPRTRKGSP